MYTRLLFQLQNRSAAVKVAVKVKLAHQLLPEFDVKGTLDPDLLEGNQAHYPINTQSRPTSAENYLQLLKLSHRSWFKT